MYDPTNSVKALKDGSMARHIDRPQSNHVTIIQHAFQAHK